MLEVNNVCVSFRSERQEKIFGTARNQVLFDVSLKVSQGTCLGILGESGSGKSTLGRVICGLLKPDTGEVKIQDVSVYASRNGRKNLQKRLSVVFQDYTTSVNPRFRVKEIIAEGLAARERNQKIRLNRLEEINRLLELVGVNSSYANRYPHELSGGMLQRAMIAAAIIRNVGEYGGGYTVYMGEINDIGGICLSLFLGMAMITLKIWQLAELALPLIVLLAGQTLFMILYVVLVVFNVMGRDYDAAVIVSGTCGFGMGATPNAMANMQAICDRYSPSVKAYLLIPLVGSLFADFLNSLVITVFINFI